MADIKTAQREVEGLLEALERFSLKRGYILTENEENISIVQRNKVRYKIIVIPIWKWLLTEPR